MRMIKKQRWTMSSALSMAAVICATGAASAGAPTVVTGPSPFAACDVSGEPGTNYINAEVEPWIDANPSNPRSLVAGWQQDRWSDGGSRSLLSAYSRDGGTTWNRVVVPGINKCSGGSGDFAFDRASDPWVAISPDGTSYFMSLSFYNDRPDGGFGENAMLVSRSTDGGASWGPPTVLRRDTDGRVLNDKNSMTADPLDAHFVYATWDRLFSNDLPVEEEAPAVGGVTAANQQHDGVLIARERYRAAAQAAASPSAQGQLAEPAEEPYFEGPTYFARTTDGGLSWEEARLIYNPGRNAQTIANQAVVRKDGSVYVFFTEITPLGETKIRFLRSTDHGASFAPPADAVATNVTYTGTLTPDLRQPVRDGNVLFDVASDQSNGNLYLVWQDGRQLGVDRVAFSMSTNGGVSWSQPAIIAKTPLNTNRYRVQSFVPSVEVGFGSTVYVTYYDFRNDKAGTNGAEMADYWAISCNPLLANCRSASGWGRETRLTSRSFDMLNAPFAGGYFLGDYQGLVRQGKDVRALFGITTGPGLTDMVTNTVR